MGELHIIWNPVAGNGLAKKAFETVTKELDARGIPYTSAKSEYPGHSAELARTALANGEKKIVALGGDVTVREVASGLFQSDAHIGVIPCGTGNDISRPLGIPTDPLKALEIVLKGDVRRMDAAMANEELYFNVAGFGFDVDVLDYTEIYKKRTHNGSWAYLKGLLRAIAGRKHRMTKITWPEGEAEKNVLIIAAGNGTHFGGGMKVTPEADPFDGLLDICIIHDVPLFAMFTVLPRFMKGKHLHTKYVTYFKTTELTAICEPASRIEVDGEVMQGAPITFRILPKSLWVIVPM